MVHQEFMLAPPLTLLGIWYSLASPSGSVV